MVDVNLIKDLACLDGVSGDEGRVREFIINRLDCNKWEYRIDPMGNLIVEKREKNSSGKKLMVSAHMDEVGFIITYIEESGLLRFDAVGGIDPRVVIGKNVRIGEIKGVIGTKAVHMQTEEEREKALKLDSLFIDIGARNKKEAEELVALGDRASFDSDFFEFGDGFICAKALDDRIGCYIMLELMKEDFDEDVAFVFTTNEEAGVQGAETASYSVNPDVAIVLEATTAADIPETPPNKRVCCLKKGGVLSFMDRATIYNSELYKKALEIAKENSIPCQSKQGVFGGNEARSVQSARDGVKVLALSLPCRYIHSSACVLAREDVESSKNLARKLIQELGK